MNLQRKEYDVIVVGSGPNGLAAAITIQKAGFRVLLIEGSSEIGGGMRSAALTLPGYLHDVCSAIHPMAVSSPFFQAYPFEKFGLEFIRPPVLAAHPFDDEPPAVLLSSVQDTAESLQEDAIPYRKMIEPLVRNWPYISTEVLSPLHIPRHWSKMVRFGINALKPASLTANRFHTKRGKGFWAGMAAHSIQPLNNMVTSAIGLVLLAAGHLYGWPLPRGGSQSIAKAMVACFLSLGGEIQTNFYVRSLNQLPPCKAILFDITPRQLMEIAGERFSSFYRWQLNRYKYGMGVFKIDWALSDRIPFLSDLCKNAGTVHLGNSYEEIADAEAKVSKGIHPEKPFVLLAQQSNFDGSRAPAGKFTAWAYCHVPNGSTIDMTNAIESQVERFAPGFRDTILYRHTFNSIELQAYNPNYIGGDINGGIINLKQLFTRPAIRWSPYTTSDKGIYICSSSTPPGGGVHGMCGFNAAKKVLKDVFHTKLNSVVNL